jgi:hypothetical protein
MCLHDNDAGLESVAVNRADRTVAHRALDGPTRPAPPLSRAGLKTEAKDKWTHRT